MCFKNILRASNNMGAAHLAKKNLSLPYYRHKITSILQTHSNPNCNVKTSTSAACATLPSPPLWLHTGFLYEEKSTRLPILLCKYFNLAGAPKRTVGYLFTPTIPHCEGRDLGSPRCKSSKSRPSHHLESPRKSYGTVRLAKSKILVQMSISLFSKSYGKSLLKISELGFPHNFAKNDRQDLQIGCTDASRRQLQSVLKIGV